MFLKVYRTIRWRFSIPAIPFLDSHPSKGNPHKGWTVNIYRGFAYNSKRREDDNPPTYINRIYNMDTHKKKC